MKRASKSIVLVLIGSASILQGCDDSPSVQRNDEAVEDWPAPSHLLSESEYYASTQPSTQPNGNGTSPRYHSGGYSSSHGGIYPYYYSNGGSRSYSSNGSGMGSGGSSGSEGHSISVGHSSSTARGGFGSTGHGGGHGGGE